ncbi:hypothetical protein EWM64_g8041 [Hericium alpestre]|uniref:Uncharacterized protein n=1 Tax=Hericium alpestre TaxID=135208 RepID=A0A4Y9ZPM7_9AGAM|nr:hypothetical protein EWM64_g8041 [Hericium alpestre]
MKALWSNQQRKGLRWRLLLVALLLFVFASLDVALSLRHVLMAFIWYRGPGGALAEFLDISSWVNVLQTVCYNAQTSIADAMLIYRCYVIYGQSWKIASALSVMWGGCVICEVILCYLEITSGRDTDLDSPFVKPVATSVLIITLVLNFIATFLIVHKIWAIQRLVSRVRLSAEGDTAAGDNSPLLRAIRIVVESGMMYTLAVLIFVIMHLANNYAQYPLSDSIVEIIGIAFNLIIIRVEQGRSVETFQAQSTAARNHHHREDCHGAFTLSSIRFGMNSTEHGSIEIPPLGEDAMDREAIGEKRQGVRFADAV